MKNCTKCLICKPLVEFNKGPSFKDGLQSWCKLCMKDYKKVYRKKNKKLISLYNKKYNSINKNSVLAIKSNYQKKNRDKINKHINSRSEIDVNYKLARTLRTRLRKAVKKHHKSGSAVKDLGCTIHELKQYLESKFKPGMSWDNYGEWHIDHIKPLVSFNLINRQELLKACNYTNLQPLWAKDNIIKGSKQWV